MAQKLRTAKLKTSTIKSAHWKWMKRHMQDIKCISVFKKCAFPYLGSKMISIFHT